MADVVVLRIGENARNFITEEHDFYEGFKMMANYFCSNKNAQLFVTDMFWQCDFLDVPIKNLLMRENARLYILATLVKMMKIRRSDCLNMPVLLRIRVILA